jgi:hypothetical protein
VFVGDLGRQWQLNVVVRRGEQEWSERGGDVELGVEAVSEHSDESGARLLVEREALGVNREVDLERRSLMSLPVLIQRPQGSRFRPRTPRSPSSLGRPACDRT